MGVARAAFDFAELDINLSRIEDVWKLAGYNITEAYGYQAIGRLFLVGESSDSATFFTSLSIDGTVQACPFVGEVTRPEGGGLQFEVRNDPGGNLTVGSIQSKLCFDPGWIQILQPRGRLPIRVLFLRELTFRQKALN